MTTFLNIKMYSQKTSLQVDPGNLQGIFGKNLEISRLRRVNNFIHQIIYLKAEIKVLDSFQRNMILRRYR